MKYEVNFCGKKWFEHKKINYKWNNNKKSFSPNKNIVLGKHIK